MFLTILKIFFLTLRNFFSLHPHLSPRAAYAYTITNHRRPAPPLSLNANEDDQRAGAQTWKVSL